MTNFLSAKSLPGLVLALLALVMSARTPGYESDQYSNRLLDIPDSTDILDAEVNRGLAKIAAHWQGEPNAYALALAVYEEFGGLFWVDKFESWTMANPSIVTLPQKKYLNIYARSPLHVGRVIRLLGVSATLRIGTGLVGSDKFGHFFSQGLKYFRRQLEYGDWHLVTQRGRFAERWIFGYITTGVYSNADLVANYEGMKFYQSLLRDEVIPGKTAIFRQTREGGLKMQRPFTWRDHANDFWDEALNPSEFTPSMQAFMDLALQQLCNDFYQAPERFVSQRHEELRLHYAKIGLSPALRNRVDVACGQAVAKAKSWNDK